MLETFTAERHLPAPVASNDEEARDPLLPFEFLPYLVSASCGPHGDTWQAAASFEVALQLCQDLWTQGYAKVSVVDGERVRRSGRSFLSLLSQSARAR